MLCPVGQPQKFLFPQQYPSVPRAALGHGLGHFVPSPMATIRVSMVSCVMAPSSQREVMDSGSVCILFSMELSTTPLCCLTGSDDTYAWEHF